MENEQSITRSLLEYLRVIIITLVISYIVLFFFQISKVNGVSMLPTYSQRQILFVNKVMYKYGEPERNDIVICDYQSDEGGFYIVKRIIGVGGDCVEIIDNEVFVNGTVIDEPYLYEEMIQDDMKVDVPLGKIFVMGDNRNVSLDSRTMGYMDFDEDVIGKVLFPLW